MKKIFWTTVVLLSILVLFWAYVRLFNHDLGAQVAHVFTGTPKIEILTGTTATPSNTMDEINTKLGTIQDKLENILQTLGNETSPASATLPMDPPQTIINNQLTK